MRHRSGRPTPPPRGVRPVVPGPGQESVWDYPRPPAVEAVADRVRVEFAGGVLADSTRALRVLETSHPPVYYVPRSDVTAEALRVAGRTSYCEFKGEAAYLDLEVGDRRVAEAGWTYPRPRRGYSELTDHIAFYPSRVDACWVGAEQVQAQTGDFYGGWITSRVVGPFKGAPGTWGW